MTVSVRSACPADATAIAQIRVAGWKFAYAGLLPQDFLDRLDPASDVDRYRTVLENIATGNSPTRWHVAVRHEIGQDDVILGFCTQGSLRVVAGEEEAQTGEIYALYVLPDVVGQGIGYTLMCTALATFRENSFPSAILWVLEGNERAIQFYQRQGWQLTGRSKTEQLGEIELSELELRIEL